MSSDQGQQPPRPPQGSGHLPASPGHGAPPDLPPPPYAGGPYRYQQPGHHHPGYAPYGYGQPYPAAFDKSTPMIMYILYLVAFVVWPTAIAGLIVAYVNRGSGDAVADSHYTYGIRTFWIGLLYGVGSWLAIVLLLLAAGLLGGSSGDPNAGAISGAVLVGILVFLAQIVWWIGRCVRGLIVLNRAQAVPDPATWLW